MRRTIVAAMAGILVATAGTARAVVIAINEVDYDNPSTNMTEWVELVGQAGTDLTGWSLKLINQAGTNYATYPLSGTIPNDFASDWGGKGGFFVVGIFDAAISGAWGSPDLTPAGWLSNVLQNGPDDVIQLVDPAGAVIDEWEYDNFTAGSVTGLSEPFEASDGAGTSGDVTTYSSIGRVGCSDQMPIFVFDVPHGVGSTANDTFDHQNNSADFWPFTPQGAVTEASGPEIYWSGTSSAGPNSGLTPGTFNRAFYGNVNNGTQDTYTINIVPEPATASLLVLAGLAMAGRRRR